jgi:tetratricopeptide (TPR) repeat protein
MTAATRLKAAGFATAAFIGGFPLTKRFGLAPGFDIYDDQLPEMHGTVDFSLPERPADAVVSRATEWIARQTGRFFAWVHVFDPHSPYRPPPEYAARYSAQPYFGEIAFVDHALGSLFDSIAGLAHPTVVIVTADHGESLGEHGELTHGLFAYEPTLHVPLIVAVIEPGPSANRATGVVVDAAVRHVDILPTILDIAHLEPDRGLPGSSLRDLIRGGGGDDRPEYFEAMTFNLTRGWAPLRGVLEGRRKYVDLPLAELYDLANDPHEAQNLASTQPDSITTLSERLKAYSVAPSARPTREMPEVASALRSLGYVSGSAPARATYTAADDPKRLVDVDRDVHAATDLYQKGQVTEAIAQLSSALQRQPKMADAYVYMAYIYWQTGRPSQAIDTLERGLKAGVPDRDVRIRLGLYLAESGTNPARAIAVLEPLPSTDVEALNGLGVAYADAGRIPDAIRTFRQILALDRTNGLALQNIASLQLREALAIGGPRDPKRVAGVKDAETSVRAALEADPSLPVAYTTLGVILANTGRKREAIETWKQAVRLDASEFDSLYNLTIELASAGRLDEARQYGQQYLATAPPALYQKELNEIRRLLGADLP